MLLDRFLNPSLRGREAESLQSDLGKRVIGQDHAIKHVVDVYQTHLAGMSSPARPVGNFLFLAPPAPARPDWSRL